MIKSSKTWWRRRRYHARGILPTRRLLFIFLILLVPVTIGSIWGLRWELFFLLNGGFLLISFFDVWMLPQRGQIRCQRFIDHEVERGLPFQVRLLLENQSANAIRFRLIDQLPSSFYRSFPLIGKISGKETREFFYETKALIRGDYHLDLIYFRYRSTLGLWEKQMSFQYPNKISVIPDMSEARGHLASLQQLLIHEGAKVRKNRIGGGEFAQIRSYVVGDDPRKINWRQTGKLAEVMTNVYEPEHGKYITLLIDCGRTMGVELTNVNRLERSMEAALTVASVALQQGDYVSVILFSNEIKAFIPAGKGMAHLQRIVQAIYHIQSEPYESNYLKAFDYLERVQKRRSFILMFSDLDPFLFEETSLFSFQRIRRRHLLLILGITDPSIHKWIREEPVDTRKAMIKSMAQREVLRKKKEMNRWSRMGLEMIEVPEEHLAVKAVTSYIEIINKGLL